MKRLITFSSVALVCAAAVLLAQGSVNQEPHHKRLLYTNDIRVFDVTIPPGDASSDHVHEHDMATVILGDGTRQPGSVIVTEHTGTTSPAAYRIQNTGTTAYHAIEIENMREDGKWLTPMPLTAAGTSILQQTRAFTIYDEQLKPEMGDVRHVHTWSTIVMLVGGSFENGGIGGEAPVRYTRAGEWLPLPRAQAHTVSAVGGDAHIIEIEVR